MRACCLGTLGIASALGALGACSGDDHPARTDAGVGMDADVASVAGDDAGQDAGTARGLPDCARETLQGLVDRYFEALAAHDAASLPLADELKVTENGASLELGQGLWQKAGPARFKRSAFDLERCGAHTQAVLDEDGVAVVFGVRLHLTDGLIDEVETIITRQGDYIVFSPDMLLISDSVSDVKWEEPVPEAQRSTREELDHIADLYFESFGPAGIVAPIQHGCYRWENGVQTTFGDCTLFLPAPGEGQGGITHRRYAIADVEAGIVVGYVLFRDSVDFHMFKIIDGEIRLIQAVVSAPGHSSTGWEEQEQ